MGSRDELKKRFIKLVTDSEVSPGKRTVDEGLFLDFEKALWQFLRENESHV